MAENETEPPELNLVSYAGEGNETQQVTVGLWRKTKNGKEFFGGKTALPIPAGARVYVFQNKPREVQKEVK